MDKLPTPILSRTYRRTAFIQTTYQKFISATQFNDLFDDSPLEDKLWIELKKKEIPAERQEYVEGTEGKYFLDFTVYCGKGDLDMETDGDTFHTDREHVTQDNIRDNDLETLGWKILRFNSSQVMEKMEDYCLPKVIDNINNLGGPEEGRVVPRKIAVGDGDVFFQQSLFDDKD